MFPPELFILVGVNIFVVLSLLTSIFDGPFPPAVPYVFQIAALAGFGLIWVDYVYLFYSIDARFWCSIFYLSTALITVVATNLYIAIVKGLLSAAGVFLGVITVPSIFMAYVLISAYANGLPVWTPPFPTVPFESIYVVFTLCIVTLGISIIAYFEPREMRKFFNTKWRRRVSGFDHNPRSDTDCGKRR
ncbi:MAG: hypothetical protein QXH20_06765 [Candidatus Bathyarchaeia archaeon]